MTRCPIIAFLTIAAGLRAQEPPPDPAPEAPLLATRITAVTLYSAQALVMRIGAADFAAGKSRLEIPGLPEGLVDEAVRARVLGSSGVKLANIEVRERKRTLFKKKEAEEADAALKAMQVKKRAAVEAIQALEAELNLLKGFEVGKRPPGQPQKPEPSPIDVKAWAATLEFIDRSIGENRRRGRELVAELDGIEEDLAVASARLERLQSQKVKAEKAIILEFEASAAARSDVEVSYLVPGPGWWPRYDVRADVDTGKVELTSYAIVRQESGEDWNDVELTFSAAEPARAADLPELLAWRIGEGQAARQVTESEFTLPGIDFENFSRQVPDKGMPVGARGDLGSVRQLSQQPQQTAQAARRRSRSRAEQTKEILEELEQKYITNTRFAEQKDWANFVAGNVAVIEEFKNLNPKAQAALNDVYLEACSNLTLGQRMLRSAKLGAGLIAPVESSRGYDFKYQALRRESIPSDGAFNKVVIGVEEFPAEFVYECVPVHRELSFLTTKIKNGRRQPYLAGPASVFLSSDFVGEGRVPTTARGESFPVELGADESVAVRRSEETKRETTGLFGKYHFYRHSVAISVKNGKGRRVRVAVLDRLPFAENKSVTVERGEITPAPAREEAKGLLRWEFAIAPGKEEKIAFSYSVELAADQVVAAAEDASVRK